MDITLRLNKFPVLTLVKITVLMLVVFQAIALIMSLFPLFSYQDLMTGSWFVFFGIPVLYALLVTASSRPGTMLISQLPDHNQAVQQIVWFMLQRRTIGQRQGNIIKFRARWAFARFINHIFDVEVQVEIHGQDVLVRGNKNLLAFIEHVLRNPPQQAQNKDFNKETTK